MLVLKFRLTRNVKIAYTLALVLPSLWCVVALALSAASTGFAAWTVASGLLVVGALGLMVYAYLRLLWSEPSTSTDARLHDDEEIK